MALFNIPGRSSNKNTDKKIAQSAKNKKQAQPIMRAGGNSISSKIQRATELSERYLGKYKEQLKSITEENELIEYIDKCIENGILALDTETNGLNRISGEIAGVCLYTPGEKACYVPCGHKSFRTLTRLKNQLSVKFVGEQLQRLADNNTKIVFHNAKFDMHVCYWMLGVELKPYWDTYIASNLLNENESHNLKELYNKYCCSEKENNEVAKFNKLFDKVEFNLVPLNIAYLYAAHDAEMTYELYLFQKEYLDPNNSKCKECHLERVSEVFFDIEMPIIEVAFNMERNGVTIDTEYSESLRVKYSEKLIEAERKAHAEIVKYQHQIDELVVTNPKAYSKLDSPINIGSPTQLAILLYDVMKLKNNDSSSPRGTGEEILLSLKNPVCDAILEYRSVAKLMSTYIEAIPAQIDKKTGKLHASFNQYGAKTGRFSSSDPNLQNIPSGNKEIRKMFKASEGCVLVGGDYSQQEPRCLAHMSQDENMINAYLDGKDIYATIASGIYKMPYEECLEFRPDGTVNPEGKKRRSSVKPVLLGIMYGRGAGSIAEQMGITKKEAQKIVKDFFIHFPKVGNFVINTQKKAEELGYVETAWGRKRRLPDMQLDEIELIPTQSASSNNFNPLFEEDDEDFDEDYVPDEIYYKYAEKMRKAWGAKQKAKVKEEALKEGYKIIDNGGKIADAQRQCVNSVIQGSSADITKSAMIKLFHDKELNNLGFKLLITVHDEVIGECPRENMYRVADRMSEVMINAANAKIKVPMSVDCEITERWYGEVLK